MSFEQLLEKLNDVATLAKALPSESDDNKKIQAAAGEDEGDGPDGEDYDDDGDEGADDDQDAADGKKKKKPFPPEDEGDAPMTKSFSLTLEDGTELEAFDGTELVKSLTTRVELAEATLASNEENILKSLNSAVEIISAQSVQLKDQGAMIKSLTDKVSAMARTGRGRVSTLTVNEKPQLESSLAKSGPASIPREELVLKALSAMKEGRISGFEASGIDTALNMGATISPELISRIYQ